MIIARLKRPEGRSRGNRDMTVCIAAACLDGANYAIVLCADGKGSTPLGSKELMLKVRSLPHKWKCLTAGNEDDITPLLRLFKDELWGVPTLNETNIRPAIQEAMRKRKEQKADEYAQRKWGMPFAAFRAARSEFPEDEYRSDLHAIGQITIEADCLLAGFMDGGLPLIVQANGQTGVNIKDDFAVAGEGAWLAQYGLLHRDHYDVHPLAQTVYCVYEAKKYAERVASVGKNSLMVILRPNGESRMLTSEGRNYLEDQFQKFGPQAFKQQEITLGPGFFEKPSKTDDTK